MNTNDWRKDLVLASIPDSAEVDPGHPIPDPLPHPVALIGRPRCAESQALLICVAVSLAWFLVLAGFFISGSAHAPGIAPDTAGAGTTASAGRDENSPPAPATTETPRPDAVAW